MRRWLLRERSPVFGSGILGCICWFFGAWRVRRGAFCCSLLVSCDLVFGCG